MSMSRLKELNQC